MGTGGQHILLLVPTPASYSCPSHLPFLPPLPRAQEVARTYSDVLETHSSLFYDGHMCLAFLLAEDRGRHGRLLESTR